MGYYLAALWDMDGTLCNTKPGVAKGLRDMCAELGMDQLSYDEVDQFIGPPVQDTLKRLYGMTDERAAQVGDIFRKYYRGKDYVLESEPYEGVRETILRLREAGIRNCVATLKKQDMAERICDKYGLRDCFDRIYGTDAKDNLKKHDLIQLCCEDMGITDFKRAVMIGDSMYDAEGAANAGSSFLGVTYGFGFHSPADIEKYDSIGAALTPYEVGDILLKR